MSAPISSLAPNATVPRSSSDPGYVKHESQSSYGAENKHMAGSYNKGYSGWNWAWVIIIFIIIVVIIWLILWATKPSWVQQTDPAGKPTGDLDQGKAFLWAIIIAIIICVIIWLVWAAASH